MWVFHLILGRHRRTFGFLISENLPFNSNLPGSATASAEECSDSIPKIPRSASLIERFRRRGGKLSQQDCALVAPAKMSMIRS